MGIKYSQMVPLEKKIDERTKRNLVVSRPLYIYKTKWRGQ
jgi:hypothetical protein